VIHLVEEKFGMTLLRDFCFQLLLWHSLSVQ